MASLAKVYDQDGQFTGSRVAVLKPLTDRVYASLGQQLAAESWDLRAFQEHHTRGSNSFAIYCANQKAVRGYFYG